MAVHVHTRKTLNPNILLLDGISRSGKFFLGKIVSHCERVEYFDYCLPLEHVPIYWRFGCYAEGAAVPILKTLVDLHVYERAIGRHMNTRADDDTAISKAPDYPRYAERMLAPRGPGAAEAFAQERRYSAFLTHETLPNIGLYLEAYPQMKVLNLQRHPVDLIHSWHRKELGQSYGTDTVVFRPLVAGKKGGVPWFAYAWTEEYEALSPVDREIRGVLQLQQFEQDSFSNLTEAQKKSICFISYERMVTAPDSQVALMEEFLETRAMHAMPQILIRERCNRPLALEERHAKFLDLAKIASPACVSALREASRRYEARWEMAAFENSAAAGVKG